MVSHPIERAYERYGVRLSTDQIEKMQERIRSCPSGCVHKTSDAELHLVGVDVGQAKPVALVALYVPSLGKIVTFYPPEAAIDAKARRRLLIQEKATLSYKDTRTNCQSKFKRELGRRSSKESRALRQARMAGQGDDE